MNELIMPRALKSGDTIALISISGGRGGDANLIARFEEGKRRLENLFKINVITTPNALKGNEYLYGHPEARGADLMWALENKDINGIIRERMCTSKSTFIEVNGEDWNEA